MLIAGLAGGCGLLLVVGYLKARFSGNGDTVGYILFCAIAALAMLLVTFMVYPAIFWGLLGFHSLIVLAVIWARVARHRERMAVIQSNQQIHALTTGAAVTLGSPQLVGASAEQAYQVLKRLTPNQREIVSWIREGYQITPARYQGVMIDAIVVPGDNRLYPASDYGLSREEVYFFYQQQENLALPPGN